MNICLIHSVIRRPAAKALAIVAIAALTAIGGGDASAQSGLVNQAASFGPGTQIVSASSVRTAADIAPPQQLAPGAISQAVGLVDGDVSSNNALNTALVGHHGSSCNQPYCHGSCGTGSCGNGNCGRNRPLANPCGSTFNPYNYVIVEGLYMDRQGESRFSLTRNTTIGDFDFDWAPRVTIGRLPTSTNGYEFTWVGEFQWDRSLTVVDPNGTLNTVLFDGDGAPDPNVQNDNNFDGTFLDPLFDSNVQIHRYISRYWSAEVNKTCVGWDVVKLLFGGRYIRMEEDLFYGGAKNIFNSTADAQSSVTNDMIGLQVGMDLMYPVARHFYSDLRARGGGYVNFAESNVLLRNQGAVVLRTPGNDSQIAGLLELGGGLRYQMNEMFSIRAGGEMWYLYGVATAPNQLRPGVTPFWGHPIDTDEGIFFYGATLSAEFRF